MQTAMQYYLCPTNIQDENDFYVRYFYISVGLFISYISYRLCKKSNFVKIKTETDVIKKFKAQLKK